MRKFLAIVPKFITSSFFNIISTLFLYIICLGILGLNMGDHPNGEVELGYGIMLLYAVFFIPIFNSIIIDIILFLDITNPKRIARVFLSIIITFTTYLILLGMMLNSGQIVDSSKFISTKIILIFLLLYITTLFICYLINKKALTIKNSEIKNLKTL